MPLVIFKFCFAQDYLSLIRQKFVEHNWNDAIKIGKEWQKAEPDNPFPHYFMSYAYYLTNFPDEGWNNYVDADRMDPKAKNFLPVAEKIVEEKPNDSYLLTMLGDVYLRAGKFDEGIKVLNKALGINPNCGATYLVLGCIYEWKREYKKAVKAYKEGIKRDPYFLVNYTRLGKYLRHVAKKLKEAEKVYEEGLKRSRKYKRTANFHLKLSWVYVQEKKYEKAIKIMKEGLKLKPDNPGLWVSFGDIYFEKGDFDKAEEIYKKSLKYSSEKRAGYEKYIEAKLKQVEEKRKGSQKIKW